MKSTWNHKPGSGGWGSPALNMCWCPSSKPPCAGDIPCLLSLTWDALSPTQPRSQQCSFYRQSLAKSPQRPGSKTGSRRGLPGRKGPPGEADPAPVGPASSHNLSLRWAHPQPLPAPAAHARVSWPPCCHLVATRGNTAFPPQAHLNGFFKILKPPWTTRIDHLRCLLKIPIPRFQPPRTLS